MQDETHNTYGRRRCRSGRWPTFAVLAKQAPFATTAGQNHCPSQQRTDGIIRQACVADQRANDLDFGTQ